MGARVSALCIKLPPLSSQQVVAEQCYGQSTFLHKNNKSALIIKNDLIALGDSFNLKMM
ncbi:MAG: hypothetical protein ACI9WH_000822 [Glaciecola sp.]|jgi:hypothetical protein